MSTSKRARWSSTWRSCTPGRRSSPAGSCSVSTAIDVRVRWRSSDSVPVSTVLPARMIVTRSHSSSTSARMWLESSTVRPRLARLLDAGLEHRLHQRVEPGGRLVEDEQLGVGGERGDERDLLPVALGVRAALLRRVELEALEQLGAPLPGRARRAAGRAGRSPRRRSGSATGSRRRARRPAGGAARRRRATGRRRAAAPRRASARSSPSSTRMVVDLPDAVRARGSRAPRRWRPRGRGRRGRGVAERLDQAEISMAACSCFTAYICFTKL